MEKDLDKQKWNGFEATLYLNRFRTLVYVLT